MQRPLEDTSGLDRLTVELRALERRIAKLEGLQNIPIAAPAALATSGPREDDFSVRDLSAVAGRAILGLAGAFLLRAVAEMDLVPRLAVLAVAIAYSGAWLWFASRNKAIQGPGSLVYSLTAAFILAPLLWESTVRFGLLSHVACAALIIALPITAGVLGVPAWPAIVASAATAIALVVRTGDPLPFVVATLLIAAFMQVKGEAGPRDFAALAGSLTVLIQIWVEDRAGGVVGGYVTVAPVAVAACACAPSLLEAGGMLWRRTACLRELLLFGIAVAALVSGAPVAVSGGLLILFCAASFWISIAKALAMPLGLAGTALLFPHALAVLLWCAASIAVAFISRKHQSLLLAWHGVALILSAALLSGFAFRISAAFAENAAGPLDLAVGLLWAAAGTAALLSIWAVWPMVILAGCSAIAAGTMLAELSHAGPHLLPALLTLYLCATALATSYVASRRNVAQLNWIGYGLLTLAAVKLLIVDFRESRPAMLALSLVCFGAALILFPRLKPRTGVEPE